MNEILPSYVNGRWQAGSGSGVAVADASTGETVATVSSEGIDLAQAVDYARGVGGPALRALNFHERAAAVKALALALDARKEELYDLSARTGATRPDAVVDVDGGIGTALVFSSLARKGLPESTVIVEDDLIPLARDGSFAAQHVLTSRRGVVVQINAFNFPVWGIIEKLSPALLAGVPTLVKPATPTAYVAEHAVRIIVEAGVLPEGAIQLVCGSVSGVFDLLGGQDSVGFTGSAETGARLRSDPAVTRRSVRINIEADSLNCSVLGPDAVPGEPEFDLFVSSLASEITEKAGQKCTAIRRAFVPASSIDTVSEAVEAALAEVVIGAPQAEGVRMGPLVGLEQRQDVIAAADQIAAAGRVVAGTRSGPEVVGADAERGAFMSPMLVRVDDTARPEPHQVEAFGPVSTLMPYSGSEDLVDLLAAGQGALVGSIVSHDPGFVREVVLGAGAYHGRLHVLDRASAGGTTGHGIPMPQLVHGGPGRAGGGEEEGGLRAVYGQLQRTAVQGHPDMLAHIGQPSASG